MKPRLRHALLALATVTTFVTLAPQSASADPSPITIEFIQNSGLNIDQLEIGLAAPTAITSISATLDTFGTSTPVTTVTDFTFEGGTEEQGYWDSTSPLKLPLGAYTVDLTVTDAGGDTLTQDAAGQFDSLATITFKNLQVDRTTTDIAHQEVTISGQLIGHPPIGPAAPMADTLVYIANSGEEDIPLTTDANGNFTGTDHIVATESIGMIYPGSVQNYVFSESKTFPITLKTTKTRILLTVSSKRIQVGQSISVSGTLQWHSPTGWQGLANKTVNTNTCLNDFEQTSTDNSGDFTFPSYAPPGVTCDVEVSWLSDDPYLVTSTADATVQILQPVDFLSFTAVRDDATTVTASGNIEFPGILGQNAATVTIETSANGHTGWTAIAVTTADLPGYDGQGYGFSVDVPSTTAGFWRATFDGGTQFTNATSTVASVPAP